MRQFENLTEIDICTVSDLFGIEKSIISDLVHELVHYENYLHDSIEEFKKLPFSKYDELPWSCDKVGWANLSLYYYSHQKELELSTPGLFLKSKFIAKVDKTQDLKLSEYISNHIIKIYLGIMVADNLILSKDKAEDILLFNSRKGKRVNDETVKRNKLIQIAAAFLKRKGIEDYAPIVQKIFQQAGYKGISTNSIRVIVNRT